MLIFICPGGNDMKKAASILVLIVLMLAGLMLPSYAWYEGPYDYTNVYKYWNNTNQMTIVSQNKVVKNGNAPSVQSGLWKWYADNTYMGSGNGLIYFWVETAPYIPPPTITYSWGVDAGFNCENSYAQFRTFSLDLTVNTQGYQAGELSFKQYVQRQTSIGWMTLNVESPVSIQTNLGIGKSNKIPLWSIVPYQSGTYRYIVNGYKNGVIVPGGSTSKTFDVQTAPTWVNVTTRTAITMDGDTFTPQDQRQVEILSPDDDSTWSDEVLARVGVYGVVNGHIHSEGYDETSIVLWSINPDDPADYQSYFYQLNGIQGDTYFVNKMPLPAGYGECFVYVTGGSSSDVETSYYQIEEDGKWWHVIDIVKIYTEPTVLSGRGSDYWWDKDSGNYIDDPFDLNDIVDSVTNFVGGFAGFFTIVQASMMMIPSSIIGLGIFGATMTLILVLFRRA